MKQIHLTHIGRKLNQADIADLEKHVGGELCESYKNFLLEKNGGMCEPPIVSGLIEHPIQMFFRLELAGSGLHRVFDDLNENRSNKDLIGIASTAGEELVCIRSGTIPSVSLVDAEGVEKIVAQNWTSFAESLSQPSEADEPPLARIAEESWSKVSRRLAAGLEAFPPDELSLLCQAIRVNNSEVVRNLLKLENATDRLDDALEVAVLNNHLEFVKLLIEAGASVELGADLAVGEQRAPIRDYLKKPRG